MKHIAIITTSFPDRDPGSEAAGSFVEDFAEVLSNHVGVTVIAPSLSQRKDERHGNLTIRRFAVPRLPLSLLNPANPIHWPLIIKTLRAGQQAVQRLAGEARIDHILALWILPSGYWARNIWKSHGIPYSVWALGSDVWNLGKIPLVKNLLKVVLCDSFMCFADGYILKKDVEKISGKSCEFLASTRRLPTVGKKRLTTAPPYKLAYLGRWHHNKGTDILLDSLHLLDSEDWNKIKEVRICGGGPLEKTVKSGCATLRKAGRPVILRGYLNKSEATELLSWADYLLIPSRIESIPIIFSDAMQCMCPVIATPVGDLPRLLLDYQVGVLATNLSAQAFAFALSQILQQSPQKFAAGLKHVANDFSLEHIVETLLPRFQRLFR